MATNFFDSMVTGSTYEMARERNDKAKLPRMVRAGLIAAMSAILWAAIVSLVF